MILSAPGAPLRLSRGRIRYPGPATCASRSAPAACAEPICMSWMANCLISAIRSSPAMRWSAGWTRLGPVWPPFALASGSVFPGSVTPAANVPIAGAGGKTSATARASRVTRATAALPRILSRTPLLLSAWRGRRRRRHRALALRRSDRLALARDGGRWKASRHLRLRCGRPYHRTGSPLAGAFGLCVHPRRRCRGAGPCKSLGQIGPAGRRTGLRCRSMPRLSSRRCATTTSRYPRRPASRINAGPPSPDDRQ